MTTLTLALLLANIAASRPDPAEGGLHASPTPVHVVRETLELDCIDDGEPLCTFTATYALENPTGEPQPVELQFVGSHVSNVHFALNQAELPSEHDAANITVAAATAELKVSGTLVPGRYYVPSYAKSANATRHPLLGSEVPRSNVFDLAYEIAPIRSWAGPAPKVAVTFTHPRAWRVTLQDQPTVDGRLALELDANEVDRVRARLELPGPHLFNGGPFVGAGGAVPNRFRFRAGYEIAAPEWLFHSLAVETDFTTTLTLVPVIHAASEALLVIVPSISAGLGLPIDLKPTARVGGRVQVTLHWPFVGFVAALDVFPGTNDPVRVTLMGQIGL